MDTTTMETLLYSWLPVLVIIGAWFLGMFLARRNRRGLFLGLSATPVLTLMRQKLSRSRGRWQCG